MEPRRGQGVLPEPFQGVLTLEHVDDEDEVQEGPLVYISAWLKRHPQAIFTCALLNAQPMDFYAPAQLIRDVRDHGVEVRPVSVNHSQWDCTLEHRPDDSLALRLGFRQIKGMREENAGWIAAARGNGYPDVESLWRRPRPSHECFAKVPVVSQAASALRTISRSPEPLAQPRLAICRT